MKRRNKEEKTIERKDKLRDTKDGQGLDVSDSVDVSNMHEMIALFKGKGDESSHTSMGFLRRQLMWTENSCNTDLLKTTARTKKWL